MTTKEAFQHIISTKEIYSKLDINPVTLRSIRKRFKEGNLSVEKMEELIIQAGGKVKQEKIWNL